MVRYIETLDAANVVVAPLTQAEMELMVGGIGLMVLNSNTKKICIKFLEAAGRTSWYQLKSEECYT